MKQTHSIVALATICILVVGITSASGLDIRPRQILIEARIVETSFEDLEGVGVGLGLVWDAPYLDNIPVLRQGGSWEQEVSVSYLDLDDTTAIGLDLTLRNTELLVLPVLGKKVAFGAGAKVYGLRTESYSDHRVVEVQQQDPVYWDRIITVRQTVNVDAGDTTLIGGGLQASARVPVFGKIPIIGTLFAGRSLNEDSTELIIMISTRIVLQRE